MGPLATKTQDMKEFGPHPDDKEPLEQSTYYEDRIFLKNPRERRLMIQLITKEISPEQFLTCLFESENGKLIYILVKRVVEDFQCIPNEYLLFLADLSKVSSVTGYLQIKSNKVLEVLQDFIDGSIDICSANQKENLDLIRKEVPALWKSIHSILMLEKARHLKSDMKEILRMLIYMRVHIFETAAQRSSSENIKWEGGEHQTMYYPLWKILHYPKHYNIGKANNKNIQKEEECDKKKSKKGQKWSYGVFSCGCSCSKNITYG